MTLTLGLVCKKMALFALVNLPTNINNCVPFRAPGWLIWFSLQLLVSAQVMISQFESLSPVPGSPLMVWSLLESLSLPLCLFVSLKYINKFKEK